MKAGDCLSWERAFTEDDIRLFGKVSGDQGMHHMMPDEAGRLMVHGLLTATLPTKIGGDINFIAREMRFQFHRPVFAGDTVRCDVEIVELEEAAEYHHLKSKWSCRNQHGKEVMSGEATGIVRK
ncbi:MAG TPA: MaoC family dehydratase [Pyrinomonadaceae bacterium]|nr:MaoC family dehydratase [Pyrinomonadaceae bacterium]